MIHDAKPFQLSAILDDDKNIKYIIPKYQREYAWGKDQWEHLITDLQENETGHFMGCAICINTAGVLEAAQMEVVDGQQRLTTLSLLCAALYAELNSRKKDWDEFNPRTVQKIGNLQYRLINEETNEPKLKLSTQNLNDVDYQYTLAVAGVLENRTKPDYVGGRRIMKAFLFFRKILSQMGNEDILTLLNKTNKATIVLITVQNTADAFTLFESLNNRGVPLSAMDLIKNRILSDLEQSGKSVETSFAQWKEIVERIPETGAQERFLRHFYSANWHNEDFRVGKRKHVNKSQMIGVFESLSKRDPQKLLDALKMQSAIYEPLLGIKSHPIFAEEITDLANIGAAVCFQVVLYLQLHFQDRPNFVRDILQFLVKYFVRRNLTNTPYIRDLEVYIMLPLIDFLEENKTKVTASDVKEFVLSSSYEYASDELFREKLNGDLYLESRQVTRFILSKLASHDTGQREVMDLYKRDEKDRLVWTIEHVFPEGKNIPASWVDMIADGDVDKAAELQNEWVHKLGNLTLTGYNSRLSNRSFTQKRDHVSDGRNTGYKNGLNINATLAEKNTWTVTDIQDRTEELVQKAYDIFSF